MKTIKLTLLLFLIIVGTNLSAQQTRNSEHYGKTLNLGIGIGGYAGYYGYVDHSLPVFHLDYEFEVANSFTLAPFISFYSYKNRHNWDNNYYYYHQTVIPIGIKGTYYFDRIFEANSDWDFYLAGSLGFAVVNSSWDDGYNGDRDYYNSPSPLFLDLHVGTEYHFNNKVGMFLDLSTGVSTIGLAIH